MASLSIVIPAFNEEESLEGTVNAYLEALRGLDGDFEIVLLDDGSTDRTRQIIERLASHHPGHIVPLFHARNEGMALSFEKVLHAASKEYVLLLGADGQYPSEIIATCLPHLASCDVLICQRRQKHYSLYRSLISKVYRWLCSLCFGIDLLDPGGAKVIRREVIDTIEVRSRSVFALPERIIRAARKGYRLKTVEVTCHPRMAGKARGGSFLLVIAAFRDLVALWWELRRDQSAIAQQNDLPVISVGVAEGPSAQLRS